MKLLKVVLKSSLVMLVSAFILTGCTEDAVKTSSSAVTTSKYTTISEINADAKALIEKCQENMNRLSSFKYVFQSGSSNVDASNQNYSYTYQETVTVNNLDDKPVVHRVESDKVVDNGASSTNGVEGYLGYENGVPYLYYKDDEGWLKTSYGASDSTQLGSSLILDINSEVENVVRAATAIEIIGSKTINGVDCNVVQADIPVANVDKLYGIALDDGTDEENAAPKEGTIVALMCIGKNDNLLYQFTVDETAYYNAYSDEADHVQTTEGKTQYALLQHGDNVDSVSVSSDAIASTDVNATDIASED